MPHGNARQRRIDLTFPIRVKIHVPPTGLGNRLSEAQVWLKENLPG